MIHLAAAFDVVGTMAMPNHDLPYPMGDITYHHQVMSLAKKHEAIVLGDPRFGVTPETLIRVREAT